MHKHATTSGRAQGRQAGGRRDPGIRGTDGAVIRFYRPAAKVTA
jgi:hypothetical protein